MSAEIVHLSWGEVQAGVNHIAERYNPRPVYGVPRGGCVPAAMLAAIWHEPILDKPEPGCLVIDDIIDSGRTRARYKDHMFLALIGRKMMDGGIVTRDGWIVFPWEGNETGPEDAVVRLIECAGGDPNSDGLADTPKRVVKALREMTAGSSMNPHEILSVDFHANGYDEIIALSGIKFYSLCEHHMLPFFGEAGVAYLPKARVVGLSKLARIVDCFARRLQIQERMTVDIAHTLLNELDARGVAVIVSAHHMCMGARGIQKPDAAMTTSAMLGVFREKPEARAEVLRLLQKGGL